MAEVALLRIACLQVKVEDGSGAAVSPFATPSVAQLSPLVTSLFRRYTAMG